MLDAKAAPLKLDFAAIRQMFGGKLSQGQVDGINTIARRFDLGGDGHAGCC